MKYVLFENATCWVLIVLLAYAWCNLIMQCSSQLMVYMLLMQSYIWCRKFCVWWKFWFNAYIETLSDSCINAATGIQSWSLPSNLRESVRCSWYASSSLVSGNAKSGTSRFLNGENIWLDFQNCYGRFLSLTQIRWMKRVSARQCALGLTQLL